MINLKTGKPYTKEDIIEKANKPFRQSFSGSYINTDGIQYDLDGKGMAEFLQSLGFEIISYRDKGSNGEVVTKEGVIASTNGFVSMKKEIVEDPKISELMNKIDKIELPFGY